MSTNSHRSRKPSGQRSPVSRFCVKDKGDYRREEDFNESAGKASLVPAGKADKKEGGDFMKKVLVSLSVILWALLLNGHVSAEQPEELQVGRFQIVTVTYSCNHDEGSVDSTQSILLDTATGMTWSMDCREGPKTDKKGQAHRKWHPFEWTRRDRDGKRVVPLPPLYRYPYSDMKK